MNSITNILLMMEKRLQPHPLLLVQRIDGGKSTVPQACSCATYGFTILLESTQALVKD